MFLRSLILCWAVAVASISFNVTPALAWDPIGDLVKTVMPPSVNVGKSIDDARREISQPTTGPIPRPEIEQSPTNLCRLNPQLPQCDGTTLQKNQ